MAVHKGDIWGRDASGIVCCCCGFASVRDSDWGDQLGVALGSLHSVGYRADRVGDFSQQLPKIEAVHETKQDRLEEVRQRPT